MINASSPRRRIRIIMGIVLAGVLAAAAGFGVWRQYQYTKAIRLEEDGEADRAFSLFQSLGEYRDSMQHLNVLLEEDPALPYRSLSKGDTVLFGTCEQDNDLSNGEEEISWMVLDRIDDEILLLSEYCLDCRAYDETPFASVTWETSAIREWLNTVFLDEAFSDREKRVLMSVTNKNEDHPTEGTEGGNDTEDIVFLLSETDTVIYMNGTQEKAFIGMSEPTEYALAHQADMDEEGFTSWWLRSPGTYECTAQFVEKTGEVYDPGSYVDNLYAVRPAVWLDVSRGR